MQWYLKCWKNYANFQGRARRKEYWMFALFNILAAFVLGMIESMMGLQIVSDGGDGFYAFSSSVGILSSLYSLAVLIPSLAVTVRRLHDSNRSGWWILIGFVPLIGSIWLFILTLLDSTYGPNRFGENPKGLGNDRWDDGQQGEAQPLE